MQATGLQQPELRVSGDIKKARKQRAFLRIQLSEGSEPSLRDVISKPMKVFVDVDWNTHQHPLKAREHR